MVHAMLVTANNGSFLIKLMLNKSLVDEFNHHHYPAMLYTVVIISDGCFD